MVSNLLYQGQYVEEEEVYLLASRCHVRRKDAVENDIVNKKCEIMTCQAVQTIYNRMKDL